MSLVRQPLHAPLLVGIPTLADQRLTQGALAFGLLMPAFSGGNLIGYLLAGSLPRIAGRARPILIAALFAAFGTVIGSLGFIASTWVDFGPLFGLGVGNGYVAILLYTWVQTRTPRAMPGRMMSILMLAGTDRGTDRGRNERSVNLWGSRACRALLQQGNRPCRGRWQAPTIEGTAWPRTRASQLRGRDHGGPRARSRPHTGAHAHGHDASADRASARAARPGIRSDLRARP